MDINELERRITKIHKHSQTNQFDFYSMRQFDKSFTITDNLALAECVYKHLNKLTQFDPDIIYERYIKTLDHLYNLKTRDHNIIILSLERMPIEIDKTYFTKIDFSKIKDSDIKLFEKLYDEKRKVLIHYHRIKNQTYVKIGNKKHYPIQYKTFLREIENNIDPRRG